MSKRFTLLDAEGAEHEYEVHRIPGDDACSLMERVAAALGDAIKATQASDTAMLTVFRRDAKLRTDLLAFAVRDGMPLQSKGMRDEAFADNPIEAFEAAYKVCEVSGFFARGGISIIDLVREQAGTVLGMLAELGDSTQQTSSSSASTG